MTDTAPAKTPDGKPDLEASDTRAQPSAAAVPLRELLANATRLLVDTSDSARLDAEILLGHVLGRGRSWLYTWPEHIPGPDQIEAFTVLITRRAAGEPVAYLTGVQEFWSLSLAVSPATLIPRADTELLVAIALERIPGDSARVLDLGTGTGAIALALASERSGWTLLAVDREAAAVALAISNRDNLGLGKVEILHSDWFAAVTGRFDLIVSNPPYIDPADPHLRQGDVRHEPASALVAENYGLADLAHIVNTAVEYLLPGGLLMVEHGADQGGAVRQLFTARGYREVETLRDLAGLERVSLGVRPSK